MEIMIESKYRAEDIAKIPVEELCYHALKMQELPNDTEVSITFVSDEEIHALNKEYRGIDNPTDVLSFECDGLDYEGIYGEDYVFEDEDDEESETFCLGDIVIAVDVADRQTAEFGTSFAEEIELLVVHGLLHLCGYDHIEEKDAKVMRPREKEILEAWREGHETLL